MHRVLVQHRLLSGLRTLASARTVPRRGTAATTAAASDATAPGAAAQALASHAVAPGDALGTPAAQTRIPGLVLGIESSCDDTGVAVVSASGRILGECLATQADVHAAWGGVVPKLAQELHEQAIDGCVEAALQAAGVTPDQLDAVAVTIGPGLSLCLRVGVLKARQLAAAHQLPIIPVHHMEAHALVARLGATRFAAAAAQAEQAAAAAAAAAATLETAAAGAQGAEAAAAQGTGAASHQAALGVAEEEAAAEASEGVEFPFLCLLISGGHNLLLLVEGVGRYVQLGTTLDDALGEAYDKVARLLGLDLRPSGGAALEAFARGGDPRGLALSVPMQRRPTCDFSYAGLKTAVRLAIEERCPQATEDNLQVRADIAASFQRVAVQHLEERCRRAVQWAQESHPEVRHLVVAGGVAANTYVRARLDAVASDAGLRMVCPPPRLCTDNGVMVAWAGVERMQLGLMEAPPATPEPGADEWVDLRPRWPLTDQKDPRSFSAPRSAKKKRVFTSLTQLMQQQQAQQQGGQLQQGEQQHGEQPGGQLQQGEQQHGEQPAAAAVARQQHSLDPDGEQAAAASGAAA